MFWIKCCDSFSEVDQESSNDFLSETSSVGNSENSEPIKRKKVDVNDFTFTQVLGKGSFGKVMLAKNHVSKDLCAVKIINKSGVNEEKYAKSVMAERNAMISARKHPFITQIYSCFQTPDHLFFEMEFLNGGNLLFHLNLLGRFNKKTVAFYTAEIIIALQFLHSKKIIHRDLKLENILLNSEGHCKLADFGLCKEIKSDASMTSSFCGTAENVSPEVINRRKYGKSCDWWALGVLIFRMSSGYQPFAAITIKKLFKSIRCNEVVCPIHIGRSTLDILNGLLMKDPTQRLGCSDDDSKIRNHRLFRHLDWNALELLQIEPPFVPTIECSIDTSNFNTKYTKLNPVLGPISSHKILSIKLIGFYYEKPQYVDEHAAN